jgi:hypothetical protein
VLIPLGIASFLPQRPGEAGQTLKLTVPDHIKPEFAEIAEIWDILEKALPLGTEVTSDALYNLIQPLMRPPYWCPDNFIFLILALYAGLRKIRVKNAKEGGFRRPSVEEIKTFIKPRAHLVIQIPQPIILTPDQLELIKSIAKATALVLPSGAITYNSSILNSDEPEAALIALRDDLIRWYRESGAFVYELIIKYDFTSEQGQAFLTAIKEIGEQGNQPPPDYYLRLLPVSLHETAPKTPVVVENLIERISALNELREDIKAAGRLKDQDEALRNAWNEFSREFLSNNTLNKLLEAKNEYQTALAAKNTSGYLPTPNNTPASPNTGPAAREQETPFIEPTTLDNVTEPEQESVAHPLGKTGVSNDGTNFDNLEITVEDLQSFAEYVLTAVRQVRLGERKIVSFEELLKSYLHFRMLEMSSYKRER